MRDGKIQEIPARDIVVGDVVIISLGEKLPADCRLFYANEIKVDNSSITGESEPQERNLKKGSDNPLEATNLVFSGNMVVNGEGMGIAIKTGDRTLLGQIASLATCEDKRKSQLSAEIDIFVKKLAVSALITAIIFLIIGFSRGYSASITLVSAIGIFVGFVPQGLPTTVTVLLTIAAKKLMKMNVLVKDLHGVETLGSITMLATDKTGTLTQNRMTVVGCWLNEVLFFTNETHEGGGFDISEKKLDLQAENLDTLFDCLLLCSK